MVNCLLRAKVQKLAKLSGVRYFSAKILKRIVTHLRVRNNERS